MQDIVFYVAANETLGRVRDYSNMRNSGAPLLTLGVAVCLRMRLFEDIEDSTPYPIDSFSGITDWQWRMDADFDRSTACKLVADADGISVHTVTDTVKGETMSFTEFVIPISNMNTEELVAWLGIDKVKTGLAGELVGYDNEGHAAFVLQIEDFSVRNRLAGLNEEDEDDPTPVDQEIVTRPVAEQMIQTAVSTLDAAKQDKLNAENAGTGISISSAGVISTSNVPQNAVTNLSASLAAKQDKLTAENAGTGISISSTGVISAESVPQSAVMGLESALSYKQNALSMGFWIEIDDDWISVERYHTIMGPYTSGSVTMNPGEAYKIYATNAVVTLDASNIPSNKWGMEGHAEIFVANTGYIHTTSRVVLANALEPDAVNNCTVRFHDGLAIISVEDHVAGYIVTVNAGTTAGSLYYGLATSTNEHIAVDASLNGSTLDLGGAVTNGEKHVVGNGYTETIVSGGINCTSKTTLSNLAANGVVVSSGTLTLGDVYIPSGSTVTNTSGSLYIEKVTGDGTGLITGVGANGYVAQPQANAIISGVAFDKTASVSGLLYVANGGVTIKGCTFAAGTRAIAAVSTSPISTTLVDCVVSSYCSVNGSACLVLSGHNSILSDIRSTDSSPAKVFVESGAVLDLTGNTNATPIAPGGGVIVDGGCQVITSAGSTASIIGRCTVGSIGNTGALGAASIGRIEPLADLTITGATVPAVGAYHDNTITITNCTITGAQGPSSIDTLHGNVIYSGTLVFSGTNILSGSSTEIIGVQYDSRYYGSVVFADNAVIDVTNGNQWNALRYVGTVIVGDNVTFVNNGASTAITGGTYQQVTAISKSGVITVLD